MNKTKKNEKKKNTVVSEPVRLENFANATTAVEISHEHKRMNRASGRQYHTTGKFLICEQSLNI